MKSFLSGVTWRQLLVLPLLAFALAGTGCPDNHIGRPCDVLVTDNPDPTSAIVNPQALECPSRLCLWPAQELTTQTGPFCTAECGSDDDCADGETGDKTDPDDHRCKAGFTCLRLIPGLSSNPGGIACKRVCVCKDFINSTLHTNMDLPGCSGDNPNGS